MRRVALTAALIVGVGLLAPAAGVAAPGSAGAALLAKLPQQYRQAVMVHDAALAVRLRAETALLADETGNAAAGAHLRRLAHTLEATRRPLRPWPLARTVTRLSARAQRALGPPLVAPARPYDAIHRALDAAGAAAGARRRTSAIASALNAYALAQPLIARLGSAASGLQDAFSSTAPDRPGLLVALDRGAAADVVRQSARRAGGAVNVAEQSLGYVHVSRATVVTDAAILVFREGLEAVLILAAITASFVGARRHLRRPVLLGGLAGIAATALTWVLAQLLIRQLGNGGLELEAITGLLAIAVLLLVTNWFFHRVYWSQWIAASTAAASTSNASTGSASSPRRPPAWPSSA